MNHVNIFLNSFVMNILSLPASDLRGCGGDVFLFPHILLYTAPAVSGWAPPHGGRVGGEAAHSATAWLPPPPGTKSRTKVSGDEGCRREAEISSRTGPAAARGQRYPPSS
jgi:hypothetical protein